MGSLIDNVTISEFLGAFFPDPNEPIRLRAFKPKGAPNGPQFTVIKKGITRARLGSPHENLMTELARLNETRGLYYVVNAGGDSDTDIVRVNAFFGEIDDLPIEEQLDIFLSSPVKPSILNLTRKSVHAYWLPSGECTIEQWREIQNRLIAYYGSDLTIKNPSRVMRLPRFNHVHYVKETGELEYKPVELYQFDTSLRYTVEQMLAAFPAVEPEQQEQIKQSHEGEKNKARFWAEFLDDGAEDRRRVYGQRIIDVACNIINEAPDGSRHEARRRASVLMGGGIAGGLVEEWEGRAALENAVRGNTDGFQDAMKTIESGLKHGARKPITLEDKERERAEYLASKQARQTTNPKREPITADERKARATFWRTSSNSPEALASDVLGSKAARHLLQLWAEVQFTDEAKMTLIAWESLAAGCDVLDYHYGDLYELLYKCDGSEFEQTEKGRSLKSSCRQRIADRIARFEAEQESINITFAYAVPGRLDKNDYPLPSRVTLYSRQFVAEAMVIAEATPGFNRARKETRAKAIRAIVEEKSGVAYIKKYPPRKDRNKQIADGWKRTKGNLDATVARMETRGDSLQYICETAMGFLDPRIVEYIKAKGRAEQAQTDLPIKREEDSLGAQATDLPGSQPESDFGLTSKTAVSNAESTDDIAQKSNFVQPEHKKPVPNSVEVGLWATFKARAQARFEALQWLKIHAAEAFDESLYEKPEDHAMYGSEYEKHFARFFADAVAECPHVGEVSDLKPRVRKGREATPEMIADALGNPDEDSQPATSVESWRMCIQWQYTAMRQGRAPDPLLEVEPESIPAEVFEDYQAMLEARRNFFASRDVKADMDDFDISGVH